ncbi:hypothetical protein D3C77_764730 [compost metagenome]
MAVIESDEVLLANSVSVEHIASRSRNRLCLIASFSATASITRLQSARSLNELAN